MHAFAIDPLSVDNEPLIQRIQLETLRSTRRRTLNGPAVVASLMALRPSWDAVFVDGEELGVVDTLYILCRTRAHAVKLLEMHRGWRADFARLIPPETAAGLLDDDGNHWLVMMEWE